MERKLIYAYRTVLGQGFDLSDRYVSLRKKIPKSVINGAFLTE